MPLTGALLGRRRRLRRIAVQAAACKQAVAGPQLRIAAGEDLLEQGHGLHHRLDAVEGAAAACLRGPAREEQVQVRHHRELASHLDGVHFLVVVALAAVGLRVGYIEDQSQAAAAAQGFVEFAELGGTQIDVAPPRAAAGEVSGRFENLVAETMDSLTSWSGVGIWGMVNLLCLVNVSNDGRDVMQITSPLPQEFESPDIVGVYAARAIVRNAPEVRFVAGNGLPGRTSLSLHWQIL